MVLSDNETRVLAEFRRVIMTSERKSVIKIHVKISANLSWLPPRGNPLATVEPSAHSRAVHTRTSPDFWSPTFKLNIERHNSFDFQLRSTSFRLYTYLA